MGENKIVRFPVPASGPPASGEDSKHGNKSGESHPDKGHEPVNVVSIRASSGLGRFYKAYASQTREDGFVTLFLAWEKSAERLSVVSLQLEYMYWLGATGIIDFTQLPVMSKKEFEDSLSGDGEMAEGSGIKEISLEEALYLIQSAARLGNHPGEAVSNREFRRFAWLLTEPVDFSPAQIAKLLRSLIGDTMGPVDVALIFDRALFTGDFHLAFHLMSAQARSKVGSIQEFIAKLKETPQDMRATPEDNDLLFDEEDGPSAIRIEAARLPAAVSQIVASAGGSDETGSPGVKNRQGRSGGRRSETVLVRRWLARKGQVIELAQRFELIKEKGSFAVDSPEPKRISVEEFERVARQAILIDGDMAGRSPREIAEWGNYVMKEGNYPQAIRILDAALEMEPRLLGARLQVADAYVRIDRADKAAKHLKRLLEVAPPGSVYSDKAKRMLRIYEVLDQHSGEFPEEPLANPDHWFDPVERAIISISGLIKPGVDVFRETMTLWNLFLRYCDIPLPLIENPITWAVASLYDVARLRGGDLTKGDLGSFLPVVMGIPWHKLRKMADFIWDVIELYDDADRAWFADEVRVFFLDGAGYSHIFSHPSGEPHLILCNIKLKGKRSPKTLMEYLSAQRGVSAKRSATGGVFNWELSSYSKASGKGGGPIATRNVQIAVDSSGVHLSALDDESLSKVVSRLKRDLPDYLVMPGDVVKLDLKIHYS